MNRCKIYLIVAVWLLSFVHDGMRNALAQAEEPVFKSQGTTNPSFSSVIEAEELLSWMHRADLMEIADGNLAKEKGNTVLVQALGDRIARDHQMVDRLVLRLVKDLGIEMPAAPERASKAMSSLFTSSGRAFDQEYVTLIIDRKMQDIVSLSEAYDQQPKDSSLRALLGKLLPILKQQLQVSKNIRPWI
jgi:predicted outer membrane protein